MLVLEFSYDIIDIRVKSILLDLALVKRRFNVLFIALIQVPAYATVVMLVAWNRYFYIHLLSGEFLNVHLHFRLLLVP